MFASIEKYTFLLLVFFLANCTKTEVQLTKITGKRIAIDSSTTSDKTIEDFIAPYRNQLQQNMQKALCIAQIDFVKNDGELQSTLGNLLADLSFEMANPVFQKIANTNIDFVLMNNGGLRAPISKGVVTTEHAFLLMPFENELVVTKLSGKKVRELFDYFLARRRAHPLSKQVALTINGNLYSLQINGKPFDENKSYYVLTNDYLQTGGDGMRFFASPEALYTLDYKVRDAIIDYFTKVSMINTSLDNRVIVKK